MFEQLSLKLQQLFFSRKQQKAFLEDLSSLVEDGVPANKGIETIFQIAPPGTTKEVCRSILDRIAEGRGIADGMREWFPPPIVELIRAGEAGGTLAKTLSAAARALEESTAAVASLLASTVYPIAVLVMGCIVTVFVKHSVFENFAAIKPMSEWPANGRLLVEFATFMEHWWWMLIVIIIGIIFGIAFMLRELTGPARIYIDKIPLLSLYRDTTAARFMETMGLLLSNGIVFKKALSIMQYNANKYLEWHLYLMEYRLSGGRENIADVIDTGLIKPSDILRLRVIAKGKGFEHALVRMGVQAGQRASEHISLTAKIAGGIMLFLGAGLAAFMIFAIYGVGTFIGT